MQFELLTPEEPIFEGEIEMISGKSTSEGSFGMLPRHLPSVMKLETAPLKIKTGAEERLFSVNGGFLIKDEEELVRVLTYSADTAEELEEGEVRKKIEQIEEKISELTEEEKEEKKELEKKLRKARVDLKVIEGEK